MKKIAIGGMIGVGKSTLIKQLREQYKDWTVLDEYKEDDKVFKKLLEWLYTGVECSELLLQLYFLTKHYNAQREQDGKDLIVDRDILEHWLFAQTNLKKDKKLMNFYNGLFHNYLSEIQLPDKYIILNADWETIKKRIKERGRENEKDDSNFGYFETLHKTYLERLEAQCKIHSIDYVIIDTTGLSSGEVFEQVKKIISEVK